METAQPLRVTCPIAFLSSVKFFRSTLGRIFEPEFLRKPMLVGKTTAPHVHQHAFTRSWGCMLRGPHTLMPHISLQNSGWYQDMVSSLLINCCAHITVQHQVAHPVPIKPTREYTHSCNQTQYLLHHTALIKAQAVLTTMVIVLTLLPQLSLPNGRDMAVLQSAPSSNVAN